MLATDHRLARLLTDRSLEDPKFWYPLSKFCEIPVLNFSNFACTPPQPIQAIIILHLDIIEYIDLAKRWHI